MLDPPVPNRRPAPFRTPYSVYCVIPNLACLALAAPWFLIPSLHGQQNIDDIGVIQAVFPLAYVLFQLTFPVCLILIVLELLEIDIESFHRWMPLFVTWSIAAIWPVYHHSLGFWLFFILVVFA